MLTAIVALSLVAVPSAQAETGFRIDAASAKQWSAMPAWLGNASEGASVTARDGGLDFAVPEPGKGMKWRLGFEPVDVFVYRWLAVEYQLVNYAPRAPDYFLWCDAQTGKDGLRLLPPGEPPYDGERHTVAFDLQKHEAGNEVSGLAVQCQANEQGGAHVLVTTIQFVDRPPEGAEGEVTPVTEARTVEPDILTPDLWAPHKDWLGNPADEFGATAADGALRLEVNQPGRGMKWSADLPEPVEGMLWLSVRCRALNLDPQSWNYFVYLASEGGGQAREEQYCLSLADVPADGEWHVVTAPVTVPSVRTMALQVQASSGAGWAEIQWLRFSTEQPEVSLADVLPFAPAEALAAGEEALEITDGLVPATEAQAGLEVTSWFTAPMVTVRGITFALAEKGERVAATPFQQPGEVRLRADLKASELYLLLGARYVRTEEPSYGGGQLRRVVDPHRFVVAVTYEDGVTDEFMPRRVGPRTEDRGLRTDGINGYGVDKGIDAYVVGPLEGKAVREVVLRDGMRNGGFYLAGATANTGPAKLCTDRPEERPHRVAAGSRGRLAIDAEQSRISLTLADGSALASSGPLFSVRQDGKPLGTGGVRPELTLAPEGDDRLVGRLQLTNTTDQTVSIQPTFPDLSLPAAPEPWGETWYFFPRRGGVINRVPIGLREAYSGAFPFQVESIFWPAKGLGLYLMTRDLDLTHRYWHLYKDDGGVRMGIEYPTIALAPGETWESVETVIGQNAGDWHGALQAYREWLATWYKPAAPRKEWFRKVFNFRQHFLHFELPVKSGLFDNDTKAYHFNEVVEADAKAFGGVDYLHLFDWGWSEKYGRCGDYDHWEQLGSAEAFAGAIEGVQGEGIPVGLYIEGYLVDPPSNYGQAHGAEYQLLDAEGKPYPYFAPSYNMCSAVKEWQDYLAGVYKRTRETTGALGYYVDEMGFTDPGHVCYATSHGHPVPWPPAPGQRELMRKIREALGPEAALYTEESPPDVSSQYQDGSFTYNISSVSDEWSPTHLNLYRFAIPTFKTFEIITCDHPLGSNVQAVKRVFFSGEGIWIEGIADRWFTPETREAIAKTHSILTRYADAFTSDSPTPLVRTLMGNVYANELPAGDGRQLTVWTLYNANPRTVRGPVLRVPNVPGAKYLDAWRDEPASVTVEGDEAVVSLEIGPRDVGCLARVSGTRTEARDENSVLLVTGGLTEDEAQAIEALLVGEGFSVEKADRLPAGLPPAGVVILGSQTPGRSAFEYVASLAGRSAEDRPKAVLLIRSEAEVAAAWEAGADACFTLPLNSESFREIVRRIR